MMGRGILLDADALDAAMARHGLVPAVPSETVRVDTEHGRRVSVNALYVLFLIAGAIAFFTPAW